MRPLDIYKCNSSDLSLFEKNNICNIKPGNYLNYNFLTAIYALSYHPILLHKIINNT
jgi:hypothetical protein